MGCTGSSSAARGDALASGPGAKRFFCLDDLPLSICTSPDGDRGMQLRIVGPSECCSDALWRLETACEKRGLLIQSAEMSRVAGLVHFFLVLEGAGGKMAAFGLAPPARAPSLSETESASGTLELDLQRKGPEPIPAWVTAGVRQPCGDNDPSCVRAGAAYTVGSHAALLQAVGAAHFVIGAKLETQGKRLQDELWVQMAQDHQIEIGPEEIDDIVVEIKYSFGDALKEMRFPAYRPTDDTPATFLDAKNPDSLVSAMKETDAKKVALIADALPQQLRAVLRGLPYTMSGPFSQGFQVDGFAKFTGAGWIPRDPGTIPLEERSKFERQTSGGSVALDPILEIRTLFVKETAGTDGGKGGSSGSAGTESWRRWRESGKGFAEFVSWLDVPSKTWTIYKVFLNGVLPKGHGSGAAAVAEHLAADAQLFFGTGTSWSGNCPDLVGAIADLEVINLCDVVNWNTYVLMAIAASPSRNTQMFGEHMASLLQQELVASKISMDQLKTNSMIAVFSATGLGKHVNKILSIWNEKLGLKLYMKDVALTFVRGSFEHICGEQREAMNLRVGIGRKSGESEGVGSQSAV